MNRLIIAIVLAFAAMIVLVNAESLLEETVYDMMSDSMGTSCKVTASALTLRSGPSTSYGRIGSMPRGATVSVISNSGSWKKISYNGKTGYASGSYLSCGSSSSSSSRRRRSSSSGSNSGGSSWFSRRRSSSAPRRRRSSSSSSSGSNSGGSSWFSRRRRSSPAPRRRRSSSSSSSSSGKKCTVTASSLNCRSGPSTSYSKVRTLWKGTQVSISGNSGSWYKLSYGCYVSSSYLNCGGSSSSGSSSSSRRRRRSSSSSGSSKSCSVSASSLNCRSGPSTSYGRVRTLSRGSSVSVVSTSGSWSKLSYGCYVSSSYLNCGGSSSNSGGSSSNSGGSSSNSGGSSSSSGGKNRCAQGSKLKDSLRMIFKSEGRCQNWKNDSGNWMNGKLGYTCAGIIPSVGYSNRKTFSYASSCLSGPAHLFVKCAWDKSNSKFNDAAAKVYENKYARAGGCSNLPQPAYYVCFDIAVNSGPGRSKQFISQLGSFRGDAIDYANKLNEKHRAFYISISKPGSKNAKFRSGWLSRANHRKSYIYSCR